MPGRLYTLVRAEELLNQSFQGNFVSLCLRQLHATPPPSQVSLNAEVQRAQKQKLGKKFRGQNSHQETTKRLLKVMTQLVTLRLYYLLIATSKEKN